MGVGGLRLYEVILRYPGHPEWQERFVVVATSPKEAASAFNPADFQRHDLEPVIRGQALDVLQPVDWLDSGPPDGYCEKCRSWSLRVVNGELWCSKNDSHSLKKPLL